jgi:hypothetical protein
MWIVRFALDRPYTFVVLTLILRLGTVPMVIGKEDNDLDVAGLLWQRDRASEP